MEFKEMRVKIVTTLKKRIPDLQAIYLFGSAASNTERPDSDIDLAFLAQEELDGIKRWKIQEELAREFCRNVDLIDLSSVSDVMKFQVITTGQRIYENDNNDIEHFETLVYSMYLDLNEQRKEILKDFQESGSIYG